MAAPGVVPRRGRPTVHDKLSLPGNRQRTGACVQDRHGADEYALGLVPWPTGTPPRMEILEMLQMTTQQIDDRETVDGVEAVVELADRNARETRQMAALAKHVQ